MKILAILWNVYLERLWNWIPAGIQGLTYHRKKRKEAKRYIEQIRTFMPSVGHIASILVSDGFMWTSDPMGGVLDFHQYPWVTVARRKGDCDDFAELWHTIVKGFKGAKAERVVTASKGWGFHKMCILTLNGKCYLLSNTSVAHVVSEDDKDKLLNLFYGDDTWFTIVW
jgi:hypothetical protein